MSAIIQIHGREYILYRKGEDTERGKYPHMVDQITGLVPSGEQRSLLKEWLLQNGIDIEPWEIRTTHWCILQAIQHMEQ